MGAFSENSLFEQGAFNDSFYSTGSNPGIGENPGTFTSALRDKTQFRLSFPVKNKVKMLPNSSSIYYFNVGQSQWSIPNKSTVDHIGPGGNFSVNTYREQSPGVFVGTRGSRFIEDTIAFDAHGNSLASGSLNIIRNSVSTYTQKITEESSIAAVSDNGLKYSDIAPNMAMDFPKSFQRNPRYAASDSEAFLLPITQPFLIEKIVLEVPFCLGDSWFQDRTNLCYATSFDSDFTLNGVNYSSIDSGAGPVICVDQGGPGITLAVLCQKNNGVFSIRDLVSRGFFTHESDVDKSVSLDKVLNGWSGAPPEGFYRWQANVLGIDESEVDAVVSPQSSVPKSVFTGSVSVKTEAEISNGCRIHTTSTLLKRIIGEESVVTTEDFTKFMNSLLSSEYFNFNYASSGLNSSYLTGIDVYGRGMTGFAPSGASIFGREYTSPQQDVLRRDNSIKNPYYISDETKRTEVLESLLGVFSDNENEVDALAYAFIGSKRSSPYLIYPGEKLVLAASKTRPAMLSMKIDVDTISDPNADNTGRPTLQSYSYYSGEGSAGHDVQFNTGSVNITVYGSYVREGNKYVP